MRFSENLRHLALWGVLLLVGSGLVRAGSLLALQSTIRGRLLEGCSCRVPCPCNVGQPPAPHPVCDSIAFFEIQNGTLDGVALDGVHFAVADRAGSGAVLFLDLALTKSRSVAARRLAEWILSQEGTSVKEVVQAPLSLNIGDTYFSGSDWGENIHLVGRPLLDSKGRPSIVIPHPIIFGTFPLAYAQKGLSTDLRVRTHVFSFEYNNTNLNNGVFEFSSEIVTGNHSEVDMRH